MPSTSTTTGQLLRERISRRLGDYKALSLTSNGTATTINDTKLGLYADASATNPFKGYWVMMTSGTDDGLETLVTGSSHTLGSESLTLIALSADSATLNNVTYELHRYQPSEFLEDAATAIRNLYRMHPLGLYLPVIDETLWVNNVLLNSDMEVFDSGFTSWSEEGSPTITKEATIVFHGSGAAKIVAGGSPAFLTQSPTINIEGITEKLVTLRAWLYATEPDTIRINLDFGSETVNGDFHTGADQQEQITLNADVPSAATKIQAEVEVAGSGTAYADMMRMSLGRIHRYTIPSAIRDGPNFVDIQADENDPVNGTYLPLREGQFPIDGRTIRLTGRTLLTRATDETTTIEADENEIELIANEAIILFARRKISQGAEKERFTDILALANDMRDDLLESGGMQPMSAEMRRYKWHVDNTSSARTLVFDGSHGGGGLFG